MSTPQEREANDKKVQFIISEAAGNDVDAIEYLALLAALARITDDIYDEYENISRDNVLAAIEISFYGYRITNFLKSTKKR